MTAHRITTLPSRLRDYTDQEVPLVRKFYEGAVNCKFPARQINGVWHYLEADIPAIAAAFELTPKAAPAPAAPSRRRKTPAEQHAAA